MDTAQRLAVLLTDTLDGISLAARRSGHYDFHNELHCVGENVKGQLGDIFREERHKKLRGEGPLVSMRKRLGMLKHTPINHFDLVKEDDKAETYHLYHLIEVTFPTEVTWFGRGGHGPTLKTDDYPELPTNPDDWNGGIYAGPRMSPVLVVPVALEKTLSYVVYKFQRDAWGSDDITIMTFVEAEKEWVDHDFIEVLSLRTLRKSFRHTVFNATGYLPPGGITYNNLDKVIKKHHRNLAPVTHVRLKGFDLKIVTDESDSTLRMVEITDSLYRRDNLQWDDLDPTYQVALMDKLETIVKEPLGD